MIVNNLAPVLDFIINNISNPSSFNTKEARDLFECGNYKVEVKEFPVDYVHANEVFERNCKKEGSNGAVVGRRFDVTFFDDENHYTTMYFIGRLHNEVCINVNGHTFTSFDGVSHYIYMVAESNYPNRCYRVAVDDGLNEFRVGDLYVSGIELSIIPNIFGLKYHACGSYWNHYTNV